MHIQDLNNHSPVFEGVPYSTEVTEVSLSLLGILFNFLTHFWVLLAFSEGFYIHFWSLQIKDFLPDLACFSQYAFTKYL